MEKAVCEILSAEIQTVRAIHSGVSYHPYISFQYAYNGEIYTEDATFPLDIYDDFTNVAPLKGLSEGDANAILEKYTPGASATVYIRPAHPNQAFLVREIQSKPYVYLAVIALVLFLLGIGALYGVPGRPSPVRTQPDESGGVRLFPEVRPAKRLRQSGLAAAAYLVLTLGPFVHYFVVAAPPHDSVLTLWAAAFAAGGLVPAYLVWQDYGFASQFRTPIVVQDSQWLTPGETSSIRIVLESKKPVAEAHCDAALVRVDTTFDRQGISIRIQDEEQYRRTETIAQHLRLDPGAPQHCAWRIEVPVDHPASSPPNQEAYPRHKWFVSLTLDAPRCRKYELRYPISMREAND